MPAVNAPKSRRSDATRNRERLLVAARQAFATRGHDVPLEEVARIADVSRTTLYRNFATREELAAMVFEDNVARIEARAQDLADSQSGVIELFDYVLDMLVEDRGLVRVLSGADVEWFTGLSQRTADCFLQLMEIGREAGVVQPSTDIDDIMLGFHMLGSLADTADPQNAITVGRRMLHRALFLPVPG